MSIPNGKGPGRKRRTIVFVTYESEFTKAGGLGAVMEVLPGHMIEQEDCLVLAPFFKRLIDLNSLLAKGKIISYRSLPGFSLWIGRTTHEVELTLVTGKSGLKTCLVWSPGFFTAPENPYITPFNVDLPLDHFHNPVNLEALIEGSLFLCATAPGALRQLMTEGLISRENLVLHLQDWETAPTVKALHNYPELDAISGCMLTLHNPYDQFLGWRKSTIIHDLLANLHLFGEHALPQTMAEIHGPITTVSDNFARELLEDPLQTYVLAGGINWLLNFKGLKGIDNGVFGQVRFPFSARAREMAESGNFAGLGQEKLDRRKKLSEDLTLYISHLKENSDSAKQPWGRELDLADPLIPVFLIIGRDDPRQKGFDVIAEAIWRMPAGRARYIFTPNPGEEGLLGLEFLKKLAEGRPGEVMVLPFRLDPEPFLSLQKGSSFMVMGSFYEPFGAANEAYLAGMPVVARATGGLVQQVVPYQSYALSAQGIELCSRYHHQDSQPTGFLYRESNWGFDEVGAWRGIINCAYWSWTPKGDRILERKANPLFMAMVEAAITALTEAIDLYTHNQDEYARMIYSGYLLLNNFNWEKAVEEYRELYNRIKPV